MLQPFTRNLNFRIVPTSLEFSKNETAMVARTYSALSVARGQKTIGTFSELVVIVYFFKEYKHCNY